MITQTEQNDRLEFDAQLVVCTAPISRADHVAPFLCFDAHDFRVRQCVLQFEDLACASEGVQDARAAYQHLRKDGE